MEPPAKVALPKPDGDFYQMISTLSDAEQDVLKRVRAFMESKVAPIINKYWAEDSFPFELVPGIRDLKIAGAGYEGYECAGGSTLVAGFIAMEIARIDCSCATFFWRSQRLGHGINLSLRVGRAKTKMVATDGPAGEDRLFRID
jgi:alkylation response protein AidB-like acyl-CoA dehydrogenase